MERRSGQRVGFLLSQLGSHSSALFADLIRPLGVTPAEAGVLRLLHRSPGLSQRELATRLGIAPSRVVVLIDALERAGLVVRAANPTDRRHHRLELSERGAETMTALRHASAEQSDRLLAPLSPDDARHLTELLSALAEGLGVDSQIHRDTRDAMDRRSEPGADRPTGSR